MSENENARPVEGSNPTPTDAEPKIANEMIDDGSGSVWTKCQAICGLQVVRPGKVQCWCDGIDMPAPDVVTLATAAKLDVEDVAFIVGCVEKRIRERARASLGLTPED